jgi:apolipoprotein N-acyltransferase
MNWVLALASGVLLVLLFPQYSFAYLAPVALTPLIIACAREAHWRWRFGMGYAAGVVYWFGLCNWIQWTLKEHAGVGPAMAWFLFGLFCLAKAVQMGVFAALSGRLMKSAFGMPAIAALWVALEWTHSYTGFEWLNLGNAGSGMSVPLRLAPITGVWGLSFVFALMSAVVASLLLRRNRIHTLWLAPLPLLLVLPDVPALERGDTPAILVQPNIPDEAEWTQDLLDRTEARLTILSLSTVLERGKKPELIVWPEAPAPFYDYDPAFQKLTSSLARTAQAPLLTGVVGRAADGEPLNSAMLVSPAGNVISRYDKVHLVPFGEFVPWPFGLVTEKVSKEAGTFEAGSRVVVSKLDGHSIGTFICYESVFPSYIRQFAASGAEALFNISNDSWFGKSAARYQHLQIVRMRAVENARWIVRATDNGITAVIDPAGRVLRTAQEYEELAARFEYRYRSGLTFYTRYGDWFVAVCALIAAVVFATQKTPPERAAAGRKP